MVRVSGRTPLFGHLPDRASTGQGRRKLALDKQLLGWAKVTLAPGQIKTVTVPVKLGGADHLLAYWQTDSSAAGGRWVTPKGTVPIYVGASSRDIRVSGSMNLG